MAMQNDSPEQLLDVFKAAALSVTRLYKSSVSAETRARADGYQDCLDDLVSFLDREGAAGLGEPGLSRMRKWAAERREGRDASPQTFESEDETDKGESASLPPVPARSAPRATMESRQPTATPMETTTAPPQPHPTSGPDSTAEEEPRPPQFIVPTQDNFTFQSDHQYPNIELLDLSDSRGHVGHHPRSQRHRQGKSGMRTSGPLGRGSGSKRRMDLDDFFGGCFGGAKDPSGGSSKRSRHS
ncbi:hypothetical protein GMORB2_2542 [Geosmithia morbida]|uniref:Uncharacterized protein n=1 Tax=Geosmithia morbida TaxID=1094350 RepID=A0A9P4YQ42_9HYPO|nr:uncharacterized protein GMORB2_2542 [Geosmithia morbida]KAF4121056.1 hypothetical protein GMORB2_2542 [Geosmithia morbida]